MKTLNKIWVLAGLAGMLGASSLQAALDVTLLQNLTGAGTSYSSGEGGEFRAVVNNPGLYQLVDWSAYASSTKGIIDNPSGTGTSDVGYNSGLNSGLNGLSFFQTFCIEHDEPFVPGTTYTVSQIGNNAMYGSAPLNGDPISMGTAYLYRLFAAGTLSTYGTYAYGSTRSSSAADLQNAIWALEGEGGLALGSISANLQAILTAKFGSDTSAWIADENGALGVYAMTLGNPGDHQDQLIIRTAVPEASTMIAGALLLLPLGASALRILGKKRGVTQK